MRNTFGYSRIALNRDHPDILRALARMKWFGANICIVQVEGANEDAIDE